MNDSHSSPLDRVIDREVRTMMQVDPRPGLRQRVIARLQPPVERPGRSVGTWALACGTVAVVVLSALVLLRSPAVQPPAEPRVEISRVAEPPVSPEPAPLSPATSSAPPPAAARPPQGPEPSPEAIFGPRSGRASAASLPARQSQKPAPAPNLTIELTVTEYSGAEPPVKKVVSMVVADRGSGTIRSAGTVKPNERVQLNVDAQAAIQPSGAIRLSLRVDYTPSPSGADAPSGWSSVHEQIQVMLEEGKALVISQAADPASDRRMTVEVRVTR